MRLFFVSAKITSEGNNVAAANEFIKLNIFGSLTYLEIKNIPINNIYDLQNLRNQLETLICIKSTTKLQVWARNPPIIIKFTWHTINFYVFGYLNSKDLLHFCGADQSSPFSWQKLHTLVLSYNQVSSLDNSLVSFDRLF